MCRADRCAGILESPAIFLPAVSIVVFCFALTFEIVPSANKASSNQLLLFRLLLSASGWHSTIFIPDCEGAEGGSLRNVTDAAETAIVFVPPESGLPGMISAVGRHRFRNL